MRLHALLTLTVAASLASACSTSDGGDTGSSSTAAASSSSTGDVSPTGDVSSTGDASTSTGPGAGSSEGSESSEGGDTSTGGVEPTTGGTTEPPPTDGPGVLPGESGLDAFCRRYVECGGTYYADAGECVDESHAYWGSCPSRQAALDSFGACMSELSCDDWSPDAYNPAGTPCAQQWGELGASEPCP